MERKYLFTIILLFLLSTLSCAGSYATLIPGPSVKAKSHTNFSGIMPYDSIGDNKSNTSVLTPNGSKKPDSQGNTSILTPNNSRGYIGLDTQGSAVMITPLRGNLGVDSNGNIWTIRPR
jgi:hypothetical protein